MQHKALMIILAMYSMSFSLLTVQYVWGDYYGLTLTNSQGSSLKTNLLLFLDGNALNTITSDIANIQSHSNSTLDAITNAYQLATTTGFLLLQVLTGTYIFNLLYLLGLPGPFVGYFMILVVIMAAIGIIAYIRGAVT